MIDASWMRGPSTSYRSQSVILGVTPASNRRAGDVERDEIVTGEAVGAVEQPVRLERVPCDLKSSFGWTLPVPDPIQFTCAPENCTTLAHFSVSAAMVRP